MSSLLIHKVFLYGLLTLCFLVTYTKSDDNDRLVNYVTTDSLPDGEEELRMRFGNVIVRQTSVVQEYGQGVRRGLMLRQIASGPHLLQMIYKVNHEEPTRKHRRLTECEIINDWDAANQFRTHFQKELSRAGLQLQVPSNKHQTLYDAPNSTNSDFDSSSPDDIFGFEEHADQSGPDAIDLNQGMEEFRNVTVRMLRNDEMVGEVKRAFDIHGQQKQCRRHHRRMKQIAKNSEHSSSQDHKDRRVRREAFRVGIMPGTLWCGDGSLADKYESMGAHVGTDRCCREHDGCPFIIEAMSSSYGVFNYRMHTLSHCTCDESSKSMIMGSGKENEFGGRTKRELGNTFRLLPGTQWCGRGFSAQEITHLGGFTGTDKCCRYHDLGCPFYVEGFEEKYGLFNWRMYTINHCTCDERFRSCLKQTNTGAANFVGKLFFNVVQTKCFVLKPEKGCAKHSWWGKCLKYEYKKQAYLRDPLPY